MSGNWVPVPAVDKWEDQPFVVVVWEAKAAGRMARTTTLTRRTPVQRLLVLVNGRYAAFQCTTSQETVVKFGIVPNPAGQCLPKRSFARTKYVDWPPIAILPTALTRRHDGV